MVMVMVWASSNPIQSAVWESDVCSPEKDWNTNTMLVELMTDSKRRGLILQWWRRCEYLILQLLAAMLGKDDPCDGCIIFSSDTTRPRTHQLIWSDLIWSDLIWSQGIRKQNGKDHNMLYTYMAWHRMALHAKDLHVLCIRFTLLVVTKEVMKSRRSLWMTCHERQYVLWTNHTLRINILRVRSVIRFISLMTCFLWSGWTWIVNSNGVSR